MKFLAGFLSCLAFLILGGAILIYSGWYDVAATAPHLGPVRWVLHTTMHNSVRARAKDIAVPQFSEAMVREGARHFGEMCVICHGAPGMKPGEIGLGLRPEPPPLTDAVRDWNPAELFWIVKYGVKMTGMPGWGPTHPDSDLWAIVAFLQRLPSITPEQYREVGAPADAAGPPEGGRQGAGAHTGHR